MTEIVPYAPPAQAEIDYYWNLANKVCKTEFVPGNLRGKPEATLAVFLTGRELGIGPMQSLRDIYPVNGRPSLMATLMVTRVRSFGHRFKTIKSTDQEAVVQIHRKEQPDPEPEIRWTLADAKRAVLIGKETWQKYPTALLWSRAASAACRRDASEALGGVVYTPEEIEDGQGITSATWGEPETAGAGEPAGPPAGEPAPAPTSEGPATRTNGAPGQPGSRIGSPSDPDASAAGERDTGLATGRPSAVEAQTAEAAERPTGDETGMAQRPGEEAPAASTDRPRRGRRSGPEQPTLGEQPDPGRHIR